MLIFDGKYTWDGTKRSSERPISWWPGSYRVRLVNLSETCKHAIMFKPYACIFSNLGDTLSLSGSIQNFVKRICRDFNLDLKRVLWVEYFPGNPGTMEVVSFKELTTVGDEMFYSVSRRPAMKNELAVLKPELQELSGMMSA